MKVWSRDKFIQITARQMRNVSEKDALKLRLMVGEILTTYTRHVDLPFDNISSEEDYHSALARLFSTKTVNEIDVNTSLILQDYKKIVSNDRERLAVDVAAAFMKSVANIATFRKKRKSPSVDTMRLYDFFAKLALNGLIEFQATRGIADVA